MSKWKKNIEKRINQNKSIPKIFTNKKSEINDTKEQNTLDLTEIQKPIKETKSIALNLLLKPSTHTGVQKLAEDKKMSKNEVINQVLDIYIKKYVIS
jgi:hypothetical protein